MKKCLPKLLSGVGMFQIYGAFTFAAFMIGLAVFGLLLSYHISEGKRVELFLALGAVLLSFYSYSLLSRKRGFAVATFLGSALCSYAFLSELIDQGVCDRAAFIRWGLCVIVLGQGVAGLYLLELAAKVKKEEVLEEPETGCLSSKEDLL